MSIEIKRLDQASAPAWDKFVLEECNEASFFHLSGWSRIISQAFHQDCHYLYAEQAGRMLGVLPLVHLRSRIFGNRLIANGFTVGGALAAVSPEAARALDDEAQRLMRELQVESLEYRRSERHLSDPRWRCQADLYANFAGPIAADEAECLKQIPRKQRAVLRKAIDAGQLTDRLEAHAENFFPLYGFSMRNMGTPVFGQKFFRLLMREFAGRADCLTVTWQGKCVASVLNFYFRDSVMPYYTGCGPEARSLGANDFMYWRLMRRAVARGYKIFDFGRSKIDSGPYHFKRNWGFTASATNHEFLTRDGEPPAEINPLNPKYRAFIALWRRLPLFVANRLGPMVIREIG